MATAYRYFSHPGELLQETQSVARGFEAVADLPADPAERLDLTVSRVADLQLGDEAKDVMRWAAGSLLEAALCEAKSAPDT